MRIDLKNRTSLAKRGLSTLGVLLLTLLMSCYALGDEDQAKLLRTLKSGIDEYLREVEFKSTYTYSEYLVDSREKAENFDTSDGRLLLRATGSLIKSDKMTFESFELDRANTKSGCCFSDHITVTNSDLCAKYVKQSDDAPHRSLFVLEVEKTKSDIQLLDVAYAPITCPLVYGGGRAIPDFIDFYNDMIDKYHSETSIDVSHDRDNTSVSLRYTLPGAESTSSLYILSNQYRYPIIISKNRESYIYPNNANYYETVKVFDLTDVGKGFVVPQKIYNATGPIGYRIYGEEAQEAIGKWIVRKWESEDLGKEPPKAEDFLIPLERDTDFGGLNLDLVYELNNNVPEYFDLNSFSLADLLDSSDPLASVPKTTASKYYRPALIVLGVLIVAAGIYRRWRNRGRCHANQS